MISWRFDFHLHATSIAAAEAEIDGPDNPVLLAIAPSIFLRSSAGPYPFKRFRAYFSKPAAALFTQRAEIHLIPLFDS
jgi:hypothetical protein